MLIFKIFNVMENNYKRIQWNRKRAAPLYAATHCRPFGICSTFSIVRKKRQGEGECKLLGTRKKEDTELQVAEGIYMTENKWGGSTYLLYYILQVSLFKQSTRQPNIIPFICKWENWDKRYNRDKDRNQLSNSPVIFIVTYNIKLM